MMLKSDSKIHAIFSIVNTSHYVDSVQSIDFLCDTFISKASETGLLHKPMVGYFKQSLPNLQRLFR